MIDNKGLTEKEIQDLIDWKIQCKEFDKIMWEQTAKRMMREIIERVMNTPQIDVKKEKSSHSDKSLGFNEASQGKTNKSEMPVEADNQHPVENI